MSSSAVFGRGFESHSLQHIFCFWGFGSVWRCLRPSVGLAVPRSEPARRLASCECPRRALEVIGDMWRRISAAETEGSFTATSCGEVEIDASRVTLFRCVRVCRGRHLCRAERLPGNGHTVDAVAVRTAQRTDYSMTERKVPQPEPRHDTDTLDGRPGHTRARSASEAHHKQASRSSGSIPYIELKHALPESKRR
jgi:hypothetical protein